MKKILFSIALTALLISCEKDFLDRPVKGVQTIDNYYSDEKEANYAVIGAYGSLSPEDWWEMDFYWLVGDVCSDDAFKGNSIVGDQTEFGDLANYNINPGNEWLDIKWRFSYVTISRCNLIIDQVPNGSTPDEKKAQFIAEAKFLRAFSYFELVRNFGGVPMPLSQLSPNEAVLAKTPEADVWNQIILDFENAAADLPPKGSQEAREQGRATQEAAWAYMAKAYTYTENWLKAEEFANKVIGTVYSLESNFGDIWKITNPNGVESIFEIQHNYDTVQYTGSALPVLTRSRADGGWGFGTPSSHLENFMAGDPRLVHTIIKEGDNVDADHPAYDTNLSENESGRINRKFYLPLADRALDNEHIKNGLNYILFRYADLLLIHAEAAAHNQNTTAALNSLNLVRQRVGGLPDIGPGANVLQAVMDERRKELALEGHRFFDLKRWGLLDEAITDFVDYNLNTSTDPYDAGNPSGSLFQMHHYLFPIPQTEIDLSENRIIQNDGY